MRIGLLEDNPAIIDYMKTMFTMTGHEVYPYTHSTSLLRTLYTAFLSHTRPLYDVLIIDILLPGELSGIDTIIQLRQWFSPVQLPIIVVSACSQAELDRLAAMFPEIATLRKPFKTSAILKLIEQMKIKRAIE